MELLIAFGTDDGKSLKRDHVGMSRYFSMHRFSGDGEEFVERRKNAKYQGDESIKHGDPEKAIATSSALKGIDGLVGMRFGPNLPRLLKKFVCIVVRRETVDDAVKLVGANMDRVLQESENGENRSHLIFK